MARQRFKLSRNTGMARALRCHKAEAGGEILLILACQFNRISMGFVMSCKNPWNIIMNTNAKRENRNRFSGTAARSARRGGENRNSRGRRGAKERSDDSVQWSGHTPNSNKQILCIKLWISTKGNKYFWGLEGAKRRQLMNISIN